MAQIILLCTLEIKETFRAKWYQFYLFFISFFLSAFFYFGIAESRALGFTGLGRILLTMIQVSLVILPIFTMMTTARTFVSDKENGIWEYALSVPIKLSAFYWGRASGRYFALFIPLAIGMLLTAFLSLIKGYGIPWNIILLYTAYIGANVFFFTALAILISIFSKSQEVALGLSFISWLLFEGLIDTLLLGLMVKYWVSIEVILGIAFLNPLQAFRMASIALFDPELTVLGPVAYTIIEYVGLTGLLLWAMIWPVFLGFIISIIGFRKFKNRDFI